MENLTLISSNPILFTTKQSFGLPLIPKKPNGCFYFTKPRSKNVLFAFSTPNSRRRSPQNHVKNDDKNVELFASTSKSQESVSVGVPSQSYVPPPSQFGSPLFWIGVGVGFSALFSFAASWLKKYAMQQAFKTMMGQMGSQNNNQFSNAAFPSGSPFGFPPPSASSPSAFPGFPYQPPSTSGPNTSTGYAYSPPSTSGSGSFNTAPSSTMPKAPSSAASATMDVSAKKPEVTEHVVNSETQTETKSKQSAFVDISPEETLQSSPFENYDDTSSSSSVPAEFTEVVQNGGVPNEGASSEWSKGTRKKESLFSVEMVEKMMEDPKYQQMIYPNLPEDMRNPDTLKWMLQNPQYRQQLQETIDNMGGGNLDSNLMENLKNYDLNSPEVKQKFDEIGVSPEEAISRLVSNPEVAMAFQNPRIQQAIMDLSQNPMNIMKYQNDKEVMDVLNKIQGLFPGMSGY